MVTATFRFYEELNGFIARERRGRTSAAACARAATTKHMIEALGVPHTEVELILVNGESSGFDRLLEEGDRVAVYPRFGTFDIGPMQRVRERQLQRPRFVADAHLGGLARLLRMAGFDTLYDNNIKDEEVEAIALAEQRVVLTRDRDLLKRRTITHGCYVHELKAAHQLRELCDRLDLAGSLRPFTLCLNCNVPLRPVAREAVLDRVPPLVRELHDDFNTCDQCQRVFWKGSHWKRMMALLATATASASHANPGPSC